MGRSQWIALGVTLLVAFGLYFGLDTKPPKFAKVEQARKVAMQSTDVQSLMVDAKPALKPSDANRILGLEKSLSDNEADPQVLRNLSSAWFAAGHGAIAGHYAGKLAELEGSAEAWSIAGTTYSLALQETADEKIRKFAMANGVEAFERAISLEPDTIRHRLNLALLYTEMPPEENPMQGILMLVDLNKQHPEDASVLFHLGRLAIKTGQAPKAVERLRQAASLRPDHVETWMLLASALEMNGDKAGAMEAFARYELLIKEPK